MSDCQRMPAEGAENTNACNTRTMIKNKRCDRSRRVQRTRNLPARSRGGTAEASGRSAVMSWSRGGGRGTGGRRKNVGREIQVGFNVEEPVARRVVLQRADFDVEQV